MKKFFVALFLLTAISACFADSRVFTLVNPNTEEILQTLHNTYGNKLGADIVRGKLVVVGSKQQLDEVAGLLTKIDPTPRALHLRLREQPPTDPDSNTITYSSDNSGYAIDTIEGALVSIDYQKIVQQPTSIGQQPTSITQQPTSTTQLLTSTTQQSQFQSKTQQPAANGWWVTIENVPTQFNSLTLQVHLENGRKAIVLVSYAKEQNQERHVFGNTVVGDLGTWIPLLPRPENTDSNTISSGQKRGEQLYLRVDKNFK